MAVKPFFGTGWVNMVPCCAVFVCGSLRVSGVYQFCNVGKSEV